MLGRVAQVKGKVEQTHTAGLYCDQERGEEGCASFAGTPPLRPQHPPSHISPCRSYRWAPPPRGAMGWVGLPSSAVLNAAVAGAVAAGLPVAVAAGNSDADACDSSVSRPPPFPAFPGCCICPMTRSFGDENEGRRAGRYEEKHRPRVR